MGRGLSRQPQPSCSGIADFAAIIYPPNHFGGWVAGPSERAALALLRFGRMTLNVYVDAFNLYYGCLMDTPYKWLNLRTLCELSFPADHIKDIHYFTARIKPNPHDPDKHVRQDTYFRALRTVPGLHIHEGTYSRKAVKLPLHPIPAPPTPPTLVKVVKIEEKGSDVNLATRLLIDAFDKAFDAAVVITNDSDLAEPIRQVRRKFGYRVMILVPRPTVPRQLWFIQCALSLELPSDKRETSERHNT